MSTMPDIHLADRPSSSLKVAMKNVDDDENDTLCSEATSAQTTEGITSSAGTNENSSCEFRSNTGDDINPIKGNGQDQTENHPPILSDGSNNFFQKNIYIFALIPVALIAVCNFFEVSPLTSADSIESMTSSGLALMSNVSSWYMIVLEEYPVLTKALTTGIIQFFGDYAAQRYEQQHKNDGKETDVAYDLRRGLSLFADGLLLSGPLLHYCFEWMEEIWPTGGDDGMAKPLATLCHVFVNDYVIDSVYIGLSFVFTGIVEGYSLRQVAEIFRKDYGATVRASWLTSLGLIPVEILCFGYLSLSFRVLAMNFVDLLWGAIVSFYSHRSRRENPKKDKEKTN